MDTKMCLGVPLSRTWRVVTMRERWSLSTARYGPSCGGASMIRWKLQLAAATAVMALSLAGFYLNPASGSAAQAARPAYPAGHVHPKTGVGSCTLKGWNPRHSPRHAKNLPVGHRHQTYIPDNYDCDGAVFAKPGVEFRKFPQPKNFHITNTKTPRLVRSCQAGACRDDVRRVLAPTAAINPLAPFFPPFTHFVLLLRENHTFDDYLGDCATTIQAGCNGVVQSTNHISSVPNLHTLAKTYALLDSYNTGTQPPSGPNHWWLFSAQSSSSSQQQSYPAGTGTEFDRFLKGPGGATQFIMNGDFYWMLNSGSGYWRNPA